MRVVLSGCAGVVLVFRHASLVCLCLKCSLLRLSELYMCGVNFAYVSVDYSVCFVCCVSDSVVVSLGRFFIS